MGLTGEFETGGPSQAARTDTTEWGALRKQGADCAQRGELSKALDWFIKALDLYRVSGEIDELAGFHSQIGEAQMELGHLDEAVGHFKQALGVSQERHDGVGVAGAHRRLGMAFQEKADFNRAEESYREADRALEAQEDQAERALLHLHWGSLLEDLGRHTKARDEYRLALGIFQSRHDAAGEIAARRHLASALQQLGAASEAEQELLLAMAMLERQGGTDKPELIEVKNLLGGVLEDQGRTGDALELFREAHSLAETLGIGPAKVESLRRMGSALAVRGELDEATDRYKQAIDICRQLDDRKALSEIYGDLGDVYVEQGNLKEAIKVFKEAERLDHDDPLGFALAKRRLGAAYQEKGDYKRAEEYYSEADSLLDNLDDDGERAVLYAAWGSLSQERGQVRDALARYKQALAINENQRNALGEAICRRHIGSALHDLGRLEDAAEELQRARALLEQQGGEDKPELIEVANRLGAVFEDQGRITDALELFKEAHAHADRLGIGPAKVECLRRMGSALAACGSLVDAESRYREAIELCGDLGDEVALSALHGEFGDVLAEQGRLKEAIDAYKHALALDQDHSDIPGLALANRRLGSAYQRTGDLDRARDLYADAERLLQRLEDDEERALLYLQRGSLLEDEGKYLEALSEYGRARAKYENQRNALGTAAARRSEGSAHLQLGRLSDAEASAEGALDTVGNTEDKPELVACLNLLGAVRRAQGRFEQARELHSRALTIAEGMNLQPARASSLRHLGAALTGGDGEGSRLALERLETALTICERLKDEVACAELQDDIADVHLARGETTDAVAHYERGLSVARRLDRNALTADILLGLARCSRQMGKLEEVRVHLHEARAMISSIDSSRPRQARLLLEVAQIDADEGKEEAAIEGLEKALGAFRDCNDTTGAMECHQLLLAAYIRRQDFPQAGLHLSQGLELEGNVRALWAVMLNQLHPAIRDAAHGAFAEGRFGSGVLEALKCCEQEFRVRAATDRRAKMHEVITKALGEERRGGFAPWPDADHLKAFANMCRGTFEACRNPLAHNQLPMSASQAFAWLGVAHLMLTLMDAPDSGVVGEETVQ
jgi:tetratricopeptide (TPR) repeat protein